VYAVAARLLADVAHDHELAGVALRRARMLEALGAAVDGAPHPRARALAGLLSVSDVALGVPAAQLAETLELTIPLRDMMTDRVRALGQLVELAEAMDHGWWSDVRARSARVGVAPTVVGAAWRDAWRAARDELMPLTTVASAAALAQ
jgi:c-di-GMP-related signal transduction protein